MSNASADLARSDSNSGASVFATQLEFQPGSVRLRWGTYPGSRYFIERSENPHTWLPAGSAIAGDGGEKSVDVPCGPDDRSLSWRVRLAKP
jgi:hypothetical protein